jgi:hypothetical protein
VTISGGVIYGTFSGNITGTISGSQVIGNISGNAASITGTVAGSQVSGNIPGNAASITGSVAGSQVSGNIPGNAASITGSVAGSQVSGNIAGNAATATTASALETVNNYTVNTITMTIPPIITNPLTWRYYATNGMNNGINPGPGGTDGQGTFVVFNTDSFPTGYNISLAGGVWSCPLNGAYVVNLNITGFTDQLNGGLSLVCGGRALYDFCLFAPDSNNQNINTVAKLSAGNTIILSGTFNYTNIFSGIPGNVWVQEAKMCITMLSSS